MSRPLERNPAPWRSRRLAGVVSLLLALWLQAFAPAIAPREHMASDPLVGAVLCGPTTGGETADGAAGSSRRESACAHCPFCGPVATPALPSPAIAIRSLRWHFAAWPRPTRFVSSDAPRHDGRPRAPPALA